MSVDDPKKRDELLARVADVLRRSGVEDAEELVRWLEHNLPPTLRLAAVVRTDGVYRTVNPFTDTPAWKYVRFFESGQVLTVTSTGQPEQVRSWLVPDGSQSEGTFAITGRKVEFSSVDTYGRVDYEGLILDDGRLRLRWHSHINGNNGEDTYAFFPYG